MGDQSGRGVQFFHNFLPVDRAVAGEGVGVADTVVIVQMGGDDMRQQFIQRRRFLNEVAAPGSFEHIFCVVFRFAVR